MLSITLDSQSLYLKRDIMWIILDKKTFRGYVYYTVQLVRYLNPYGK